jgi:hypothetical protein
MVLNPAAHFQAADVMKGLYNPEMVKGAFQSNRIGPIAGMDTYMDQNVKTHTRGVATGTPLVVGTITASTGNPDTPFTVTTDGWTNSTTGILVAGDVVTFDGCYGVNPVSGESTGELQQFVVTADANSGASTGPASLIVLPAMIVTGPYKTCTAVPADNAPVTVVGVAQSKTSIPVNMAFNKNAFALVTAPLEVPDDATGAAMTYKDISIRYIRWYDGKIDEQIYRLDVLYGWKAIYPEYACRLHG